MVALRSTRGFIDYNCRNTLQDLLPFLEAMLMNESYTAVVKQSDQWWIGWIEEVPGVNCQEATRDELLESLRVTLREALELNRRDARDAAGDGYEEEPIAL
jgi:predicted RNase H-like HicB family nuclease